MPAALPLPRLRGLARLKYARVNDRRKLTKFEFMPNLFSQAGPCKLARPVEDPVKELNIAGNVKMSECLAQIDDIMRDVV